MKKLLLIASILLCLLWAASGTRAATIDLVDFALNIDGALTFPSDPLPGALDANGFTFGTGLGTLSVSVGGAGAHFVGAFVDHEIDQAINTFFNEFGTVNGIPAAGQSWEIDEPGFVFGDIFDNILTGTLDNSNCVPAAFPDDPAMALGFDFSLAAGEAATVDFTISDSLIPTGFFLSHTDPDSDVTLYFSSALTVQAAPDPAPVPEPGTFVLLGSGLLGVLLWRRKRSFGMSARQPTIFRGETHM